MKKILFFITAIIFITGCGASLPPLSFEESQKGDIVIVKNVNGTLFGLSKEAFISGIEKKGLKATEFAYSSIVDCTSFSYTRDNAQDVKGNSDSPTIRAYVNLSGSTCIEADFSVTKISGSSGFTFLLK